MIEAELLIVKIISLSEDGKGKGIAQHNEWDVFPATFKGSIKFKVGDYVKCYLIEDFNEPDKYYFKDMSNIFCSIEDFEIQEKAHR